MLLAPAASAVINAVPISTKGSKGSGLGLSMVYDLVKLAGGTLRLSNPGGARVTISRRGKPVAVVAPVADAAWLEAMEDKIDIELACEGKAEMERLGGKTYTLEEVMAELKGDRE